MSESSVNRVEEARAREDAFDAWLADQDDAIQLDYATTHQYGTVRDLLTRLDAIKAKVGSISGTWDEEDARLLHEIIALCDGSVDPPLPEVG